MTNNEEQQPQRRKLDAAGWVLLLFLLCATGSLIGTLVYVAIKYANTLGGGQ